MYSAYHTEEKKRKTGEVVNHSDPLAKTMDLDSTILKQLHKLYDEVCGL